MTFVHVPAVVNTCSPDPTEMVLMPGGPWGPGDLAVWWPPGVRWGPCGPVPGELQWSRERCWGRPGSRVPPLWGPGLVGAMLVVCVRTQDRRFEYV